MSSWLGLQMPRSGAHPGNGQPGLQAGSPFLYLSGDEIGKSACVLMATTVSQGGGEGTCLLWKPWLSSSGNYSHQLGPGVRSPWEACFSAFPCSHSAHCDPGW